MVSSKHGLWRYRDNEDYEGAIESNLDRERRNSLQGLKSNSTVRTLHSFVIGSSSNLQFIVHLTDP